MQMMGETLPSIFHKLNNQNFSVNNKMADFDWFKLFGKSKLTINGREAGGLQLARCIGLSEDFLYCDKLSSNLA
jgi:hypothetical protein